MSSLKITLNKHLIGTIISIQYSIWLLFKLIKLIIHIGTHKTASTSFQTLCAQNSKLLSENKILYPKYFKIPNIEDYYQHSTAARLSQKRDLKSLRNFLEKIYKNTLESNCNTSLISGEDFENFLVDVYLASEFESIAKTIGYINIEWIVVKRNPLEYLLSIYSEKSAYGVVLDIGLIANNVLEYGYFSVSTEKYNYKFVFDIDKFSKFFQINVNSKLRILNFDDFIKDFPGKSILNNLVNEHTLKKLHENSKSIGIKRKRLSKEKIEFRYIASFLGMTPNKEFHEKNRKLVDSLIVHRLNRNALLLKEIEVKFKERFQ